MISQRRCQLQGVANLLLGIIFAENCMKMKNKWTEGTCVSRNPSRSSTDNVSDLNLKWSYQVYLQEHFSLLDRNVAVGMRAY